jgi:hypothetical protein
MDTSALVDGGVDGLRRIVASLEKEGIDIRGAYLIKTTSVEGFTRISFRIVTDRDPRDVIYKFVQLRRDGRIPQIADDIPISPLRPSHVEASRVLDYAARVGSVPVVINGVYWDGLFIEDAVVVKRPTPAHAAA